MKASLSITLGTFALLSLAACSKTEVDRVKVKFVNNTGQRLNNLVVGGKEIGTLEKDAHTEYLPYEKFTFEGEMPAESAEAIINGESAHSSASRWEINRKVVEKGTYDIEIILTEFGGKQYLRFRKK